MSRQGAESAEKNLFEGFSAVSAPWRQTVVRMPVSGEDLTQVAGSLVHKDL
jgi:hypothetical protein